MRQYKLSYEVICCLLIILFFYTGLSKLVDYQTFTFDVINAPYVNALSPIIGIAVPIIELMVALFLVFPKTRRFGLYGAFCLMVTFTLYVGFILSFAKHKPCTCGGVLRDMSWKQHLWFNIFFTVISYFGILIAKRQLNLNTEDDIYREVMPGQDQTPGKPAS
jgi:putative oxidoreductase